MHEFESGFSVGSRSWHGLERNLQVAPTTEAEVLEYSGMDWEVALAPMESIITLGNGDEVRVPVPDKMAVYRKDTNAILATVGKVYAPFQNKDAIKIMQPLVDQGIATWETAMCVRQGRDVFVLLKLNIDDPVVQEVFTDEVVPYIAITNNHSGQRKVVVMETPIRIVCWNTLNFALGRLELGLDRFVAVRHSSQVEAKVVEAAMDLWGGVIERYRTIAEQYKLLKATYLDEAMFRELVLDVVLPIPDDLMTKAVEGKKRAQTMLDKRLGKRDIVTRLWTEGLGHTGDHSAWEAYNGAVQAIDHASEEVFVTRSTDLRNESLLMGSLNRIKQNLVDGLVEYALVQRN